MTTPERVEIVDVDDYTEPAAEPGYYAIYLRLSHAPGDEWRARFEEEWRRIPTGLKRAAAVVQNRLRIEIHGDDMVQEMVNFGLDCGAHQPGRRGESSKSDEGKRNGTLNEGEATSRSRPLTPGALPRRCDRACPRSVLVC